MIHVQEKLSFNQINKCLREEDQAIQDALITPYEKAMKILRKVQTFLGTNELAKELNWVIQIIHSQRLYSYQGLANNSFDNNKNNSFEMKSFMGFLDAYSESKNTFTNHSINKRSHTTIPNRQLMHPLLLHLPQDHDFDEEPSNIENSNFLVFDEKSEESINAEDRKDGINSSSQINNNNESKETSSIKSLTHDELTKIEASLLDFHFNPFDFYEKYSNEEAFFKGAYCLFMKFGIQKYSNETIMHNFINGIKQNYSIVPYYHTEIHGLDVCQTVSMYLIQTNIRRNLQLNNIDVIALIIGSLAHDVGHPGYNNDYQVKMHTDLAINYNDKNVLENYHTALTFQILKNDSSNLFIQLPHDDFHYVRKRIIELILSTDMLFHSRICALMKNRLELKQIFNGKNCDSLVAQKSETLFDDQQVVMNFLIHTADISHTSKNFNVSYKWTQLLVEEFWRQGDDEKKQGMTVNFLFDRNNAEIAKSQIGFIKGIILPAFDLIIHFMPDIKVYYDNVNINLKEWIRLSTEKDKNKDKLGDS